jgi:hypothetical protein
MGVGVCRRCVARSLCIILMKRFCSSSVSEDLGCRRGDFSRKHYGSVELVSLRCLFSCWCIDLDLETTAKLIGSFVLYLLLDHGSPVQGFNWN